MINNLDFSCTLFSNRHQMDLVKTIENLPKNCAVIFREYDLSQQKRQELALKILAICKKLNHKLFIGKDLFLAKKIGANGVHFSDKDNFEIGKKEKNFIKTLACHGLESVKKAQKIDVDLLFLSPIFPTKTHLGKTALGIDALKKACEISTKPIFALGGINKNNISDITKNGASGFGGIEIFAKN